MSIAHEGALGTPRCVHNFITVRPLYDRSSLAPHSVICATLPRPKAMVCKHWCRHWLDCTEYDALARASLSAVINSYLKYTPPYFGILKARIKDGKVSCGRDYH